MTEREQQTAHRVLSKRNAARLKTIKDQGDDFEKIVDDASRDSKAEEKVSMDDGIVNTMLETSRSEL